MRTSGRKSLLLFAREPLAGKTKTRLLPALGAGGALALYRWMLKRQLSLVAEFPDTDPQLWVDGDSGHEDFGAFQGEVFAQRGEDLGEKMANALERALTVYSHAVLIGCDCPGIDRHYIQRAFAALEKGRDIVLGPAADGGYVLIGAGISCAGIFNNVAWGSADVLDRTRRNLSDNGLTWHELESLHDIDEPGDLVHLKKFDSVPIFIK